MWTEMARDGRVCHRGASRIAPDRATLLPDHNPRSSIDTWPLRPAIHRRLQAQLLREPQAVRGAASHHATAGGRPPVVFTVDFTPGPAISRRTSHLVSFRVRSRPGRPRFCGASSKRQNTTTKRFWRRRNYSYFLALPYGGEPYRHGGPDRPP